MVAGGLGLGRLADGRVALCEGALPGERVVLSLVDIRRDHVRGRVTEVLEAVAERVVPPCAEVARGCGGCTWQYVAPAAQPPLKATIVVDAFRRLGRLDVPVTVGPSPADPRRTTLRLAVDGEGRPSYRRRRGGGLLAVASCQVVHPRLEELVTGSRFPGAREVILRVGAASGDRLAAPDRAGGRAEVPPDVAVARSAEALPAVREQVAGRWWRVSATAFFQSGPGVAAELVAAVDRAVGSAVGAGDLLLDLYAGGGLLGGVVAARRSARLVAVESDPVAAADARANLVDLDARVIAGEVAPAADRDGGGPADPGRSALGPSALGPSALGRSALGPSALGRSALGPSALGRSALGRWGVPAALIADPARTGLGPSAVAAVAGLGAPRVVLVSCDPASMARDARLLVDAGYTAVGAELVDAFPHTFHVEVVTRFDLGRSGDPG